jgi:hypothetical protein
MMHDGLNITANVRIAKPGLNRDARKDTVMNESIVVENQPPKVANRIWRRTALQLAGMKQLPSMQ